MLELLTDEQKYEILQRMKKEGLFAVVTEKAISKMGSGETLKRNIQDHSEALLNGGVSTFEATCRAENYLEVADYILAAKERFPELIPAVGTNANVLTIHEIAERGIGVVVAAHGLDKLSGMQSVLPGQLGLAREFASYVGQNFSADKLTSRLNLDPFLDRFEASRLRDFPIEMSPMTYAKARNMIIIPAFVTPTEHYNLINQGATDCQKAFPFGDKTPKQWAAQFSAMPALFKPYISICATGGVDANNLVDIMKVPYVNMAGASSLIGETPAITEMNARHYRIIVEEARKPK